MSDPAHSTRPLICLVLPVLQPAGAERIVADLARRLPAHGFDVQVICLEDERAPVGLELAGHGIPVEGLRLSRRRTLACARALAGRLPARRPLVLHAHLFHANIAARLALARLSPAAQRGVPVVNTVHIVERRFRPWQFTLDRLTARHCALEICVSPLVRDFQQARTRLPVSFFRVIENGIDLDRFSPPGNAADAARRGQSPLVLSVGRLDRQKDYPTLLRAWAIVQAQAPAARLRIAGQGPEMPVLRKLAASLGLRNVELSGYASDIPDQMRAADVYVQPSAWEGFGLTVAEAMATALPTVVSDADTLPVLVSHGRTGLVVPKGNPAALAGAVIELLRDPPRARVLGLAARAEAVARFSVDRMVSEYAAVYRELLAAGSPGE